MSPGTDAALFGATPAELLQRHAFLAPLQKAWVVWLGGLLTMVGSFQVLVAWFGLAQGEGWAFWTLAAADVAMVPFYALFLAPFFRAGAKVRLRDVPPVMWVPAAVLGPALALGAWALYG